MLPEETRFLHSLDHTLLQFFLHIQSFIGLHCLGCITLLRLILIKEQRKVLFQGTPTTFAFSVSYPARCFQKIVKLLCSMAVLRSSLLCAVHFSEVLVALKAVGILSIDE